MPIANKTFTGAGEVRFVGSSINYGSIQTASVTFEGTSVNQGSLDVSDLARFEDYARNEGNVECDVIELLENAANDGLLVPISLLTMGGNAVNELGGSINSNTAVAVFGGNVIINGEVVAATITVSGNAVNNADVVATVSIQFLDQSSNTASITGTAVFRGNSKNEGGLIVGNTQFYDSAANDGGTISGNAEFYDNAANDGGTVEGNGEFYDSAVNNDGTVEGDAIFADTSTNAGTVVGDAQVADTADNTNGTVNGNVSEYTGGNITVGTFTTTTGTQYYYNNNDSNGPSGKVVYNDNTLSTIASNVTSAHSKFAVISGVRYLIEISSGVLSLTQLTQIETNIGTRYYSGSFVSGSTLYTDLSTASSGTIAFKNINSLMYRGYSDNNGTLTVSVFSGVYNGQYYSSGVLATGTSDGVYYVDGDPASGTIDGVYYVSGVAANGVYNGQYYSSGVLATGTSDGVYYIDGDPASGTIDGVYYVSGVAANGVYGGQYYSSGVLATGTSDGVYYVGGDPASGTIDGVYYVSGVAANGVYSDQYYSSGVLATGTSDGVYYVDGNPANGVYSGQYYSSGVLASGTYSGVYYVDGDPASGTYGGIYYVSGVVANGVYNSQFYSNGIISSGFSGGILYVNGNPATQIAGTYWTIDNVLYNEYGQTANNTYTYDSPTQRYIITSSAGGMTIYTNMYEYVISGNTYFTTSLNNGSVLYQGIGTAANISLNYDSTLGIIYSTDYLGVLTIVSVSAITLNNTNYLIDGTFANGSTLYNGGTYTKISNSAVQYDSNYNALWSIDQLGVLTVILVTSITLNNTGYYHTGSFSSGSTLYNSTMATVSMGVGYDSNSNTIWSTDQYGLLTTVSVTPITINSNQYYHTGGSFQNGVTLYGSSLVIADNISNLPFDTYLVSTDGSGVVTIS